MNNVNNNIESFKRAYSDEYFDSLMTYEKIILIGKENNGYTFKANGSVIIFDGYLKVYVLTYYNSSNKINNVYTITENSISNYDNTQTGNSSNSYTIKNTLNMPSEIEVKYIDNVTKNEISATQTLNGKVGEEYTTSPKIVDGYVLYATPENASGDYKVEKTTVIYEYRKLSNVTTKYIDWYTGEEIETKEVDTYKEGDSYTTIKKTVDGYTFISVSDNNKGTIGREDIEVVYFYKKNTSVTIKYVDINTNEAIAIQDSLRMDSLIKKAYFEGAQMVRDSIAGVKKDELKQKL